MQVRVVRKIGDEIDRRVEVSARDRLVVGSGVDLFVLDLDTDPPPLIDDEDARRRVGLLRVAIEQKDFERPDTGFLEQAAGLLARLVDIAPEARELLELGRSERELVTGSREAADVLHERDP